MNRQSITFNYYCLRGVENDDSRVEVDFSKKATISAKNMQESERRKVLVVADIIHLCELTKLCPFQQFHSKKRKVGAGMSSMRKI